jgi:hypothetical protein
MGSVLSCFAAVKRSASRSLELSLLNHLRLVGPLKLGGISWSSSPLIRTNFFEPAPYKHYWAGSLFKSAILSSTIAENPTTSWGEYPAAPNAA